MKHCFVKFGINMDISLEIFQFFMVTDSALKQIDIKKSWCRSQQIWYEKVLVQILGLVTQWLVSDLVGANRCSSHVVFPPIIGIFFSRDRNMIISGSLRCFPISVSTLYFRTLLEINHRMIQNSTKQQ